MTKLSRMLFIVGVFSTALSPIGQAFAAEAAKTDRATPDEPSQVTGPSWIVTCSNMNPKNTLTCASQQTLYLSKTRQKVVSFTIEVNPQNSDRFVATIQLPHGILLQEGVQISVDNAAKQKLKILRADESGSYTSFPLDEKMIEAMTAGKTLRILVKTMSGEDLALDLTLNDFASSLSMLRFQKVVQSMASQPLK